MKIKWSVFYTLTLLMTLASCGSEQFGTVPRSSTENPNPLSSYSHTSCSQYTLIKPKVDVVYFVDNSLSIYSIPAAVKAGIKNTPNTLSQNFDYRVIVTPLLETNTGNADFQVMTNSTELAGVPAAGDPRRILSTDSFKFEPTPFENLMSPRSEKGLDRTVDFVTAHKNALLRKGAHLILVVVSNGRDLEVEPEGSSGVYTNTALFNARLSSLQTLKNPSNLNSSQLRFLSVVAKTDSCGNPSGPQGGWRAANGSYVAMSNAFHGSSDVFDLCTNQHSQLFESINATIHQEVINHQYRYWPINFAESSSDVSIDDLQVFKVTPNGTATQLPKTTAWTYDYRNPAESVDMRELPTPGEPVTGKHFIRFTNGNLITYPDCVLVKSVSKTEYFGYVVLPQKPQPGTIYVRINGVSIPSSGWTDETNTVQTKNIKVDNPTATPPGSANPPLVKTGFMLKLKPQYYYKSGDTVQADFLPAGI